ncbi:hypothetical protein HOLleu_27078 [Holothuria leucospilota]|uniref:Ig-like domain-containing protein n=1 Tax=Holothuria leucospilota TaxID=206669 RepID=A0A9Q1H220_HOLLE|nr:hypothetical protein HOLleu_27078 [Holothuria leucospilota]
MMENNFPCQGKHHSQIILHFAALLFFYGVTTFPTYSGKHHSQTLLRFAAFVFIYGVTFPTCSATVVCQENQTAELGGQGYIRCNFPDGFRSVYWFDNTSDRSPVIRFKTNSGVRSGPGFDSGDYDIHQNGSLVISNVTAWHEREYRALFYTDLRFDTVLVSLKVIATPSDSFPAVPCHNCHQDYFYTVMEGEILSCTFKATRPPVQLEWFEQRGDGYEHVEMQQFNKTENSNGTFNSLATVHLHKDSTGFIQFLVCRATWPLSNWTREREILVDFSNSFPDGTQKVQYMEVNKHSKIQCGQPASVYVIWKRLLSDNNLETIGFYSHSMTKTISNAQDVQVSPEGSLVFASPGVHQEGIYTCIYGDGLNEEIQMTSVRLLIPPSPPYIHISGCDDESYRCVIREDSTKKLTCAVYGARPNVTLEWIAEDEDEVSFFNHKLVFKKRGETYDTILSVEYKVSQDVLCGEEILIKCHLYGPLANIMKAESTALVIPASCRENEVKERGLNGVAIALTVPYVPILIVIFWIVYRRHCKYNASLQTETEQEGRQIPNGKHLCTVEETIL